MNQRTDKKDDILKKLLSQDLLELPSDKFTSDVMGKLGIAPAPASIKYEPVISKNGWIFISLLAGIIILFALLGSPSEGISEKTIVLNNAIGQANTLFETLINNSAILIISILSFAVFFLVSAESIYRQTRINMA